MKIQVNNATPSQLDFLVLASDCWSTATLFLVTEKKPPAYSTDWAQGGPIIEREQMDIKHYPDHWVAHLWANRNWKETIPSAPGHEKVAPLNSAFGSGPTLLIAAMRCYVASKLGDEVEIPDELKGESK